MKTVEKIHLEFDTAASVLTKTAENYNETANNTVIPNPSEIGEFLVDIGFDNVSLAKEAKQIKSNSYLLHEKMSENKTYASKIFSTIEYYNKLYPFNKFILYSQVINICEKYNLYLGHSHLYKGEIPEKNINELRSFDFEPLKRYGGHKYEGNIPNININLPLCNQNDKFNSFEYSYETYRSSGHINLYICAPLKSFEKNKDIYTVGHEIYENKSLRVNMSRMFSQGWYKKPIRSPKDPIVLVPCKTNLGQIGFIIVTKWGIEANDPSLSVPILN